MPKKFIALILMVATLVLPSEALAAGSLPPDCTGFATITLTQPDSTDPSAKDTNVDPSFAPDSNFTSAIPYVTSTTQKVHLHVDFVAGNSNYNSNSTYTILISSAPDSGTPIKDSFLVHLPVVGPIINLALDKPAALGTAIVAGIPVIGQAILAYNLFNFVKGKVEDLTGSAPPNTPTFGDITVPFGNNDSESSPEIPQKDQADFVVGPLTQVGPHYIKIKMAGDNTPVCIDHKEILNVYDATDLTRYHCGYGSLVGGCLSGSGQTCDLGNNNEGVQTAIGCVPTDPSGFINGLLGLIIRMAGGISLLMMAFGAIGMITSQGSAEALKSAQQRFISAIIGLLFIILAITILQIIGVDILQIPGFGR